MKDGKGVSTDILHIKEDRCPDCGSELDTGYECTGCGKDWLHVIEEDKKRREAPCSSASACSTTERRWRVKRYLIEEFETYGKTKQDAKDAAMNPCKITITKETCILAKDES